nr:MULTISPECIES: ASCH domain-containing protein [Microbacterium]
MAAVISGRKTGTSTSLAELEADGEAVPREGELSILIDGSRIPRALIRTTRIEIRTFDEVDAAFAAAEGEDDLSLEAWRAGHAEYFERVLARRGLPVSQLSSLPLVLERFELLYSEP